MAPSRRLGVALAALVAAGALVRSAAAHAFTLQIEPLREECVHEEIAVGDDVEVTAMVTRGGKLDIKLRVRTLALAGALGWWVVTLVD